MGNVPSDANAASNTAHTEAGSCSRGSIDPSADEESRQCSVSRASSTSSVFTSPVSRSAPVKRMDALSKSVIRSSPAASTTVNGHSNTPVSASPTPHRAAVSTRLPSLPYSPGSMFSPSIHTTSSGDTPSAYNSYRRRNVHRMGRSRLGLIPTVKFKPSKSSVNLPTRGSVRIPPPDRITPTSTLSAFSTSVKSESIPSTGEVIAELKQKTEKRKREDINSSRQSNDLDISSNGALPVSPSQNNCTESKRRKHDSGQSGQRLRTNSASDGVLVGEFIHPGASPMSISGSQSNLPSVSTSYSVKTSPKSDGHLRTAIASSYSSSSRRGQNRKRLHPDRHDEPLYKKSINLNYIASASRDSSGHGSPYPIDNDTDSETGSRISVTPLPSVKNSPRSSPMLRYLDDLEPMSPSVRGMITPKVEASVHFPRPEEPISGFVATLEDRAYDEDLNERRARRLLGVKTEIPSQSTSQPQPQVVMPIIKPSITIPDKPASSQAKGKLYSPARLLTSKRLSGNPAVLASLPAEDSGRFQVPLGQRPESSI